MRANRRLGALLAAVALLAGCTPAAKPSQEPTPTIAERPFTVVTTAPAISVDPVGTSSDTDSMLVASLFQRLMLVLPNTGELKPDLATDCLFTDETVYECTLPEELSFHNGHTLDSSDVRFSIQRALRVATPDSSIGLLAALKRIQTPDARTIRFHLAWPDNQFGYGLAGLAASIVDEQVYTPDALWPLEAEVAGSGPYQVEEVRPDGALLSQFAGYVGPRRGTLAELQVAVVTDSVAAEAAIAQGNTDVVWRSLDVAALQRLTDEIAASPEHATATGFTRVALPGTRVTRVLWNPEAKLRQNSQLRQAVAKALQPDRTLDSLVPVEVAGHAAAFPIGGRPKLPELSGKRKQLTLGYDPAAPGHADLARLLRDRLESLDAVSVRVVAGKPADLVLSDASAWVNNATGWLQPYLTYPLAGSEEKLAELERRSRTTNGEERTVALSEVQQQAAADNTVLPVSQSDGILMIGKGVTLVGEVFGSGRELGLWGFNRV